MKKIIILAVLSASVSSVLASACVDLASNISPKAESSSVLLVQQFLSEKGLLTAKPNGYFGPATTKAVKAYQKSKGLAQSGAVFPMTRAAIKKDTCTVSNSSSAVSSSPKTPTTPTTSTPPITTSPQNQIAMNVAIPPTVNLTADPSPVSYGGDSIVKYTSNGATSCRIVNPEDETWVGVNLEDVIQVPKILTPKTYTVTCKGTGGTIIKSVTIPVLPRSTSSNSLSDDFYIYPKPRVDTIEKNIFVVNSTTTTNLVIKGINFSSSTSATSTNTVKGVLQGTNKTFVFGTTTSADTKTITLNSGFLRKKYPLGDGTEEYLPAGSYLVSVTTRGGESNTGFISLKSVTTRSVSGSPDSSILPKTLRVKVGTITISSATLMQQQSIVFTLSGAAGVKAKISNYTLKDLSTGVSLTGGPNFSFTKQDLLENQSKIYELYVDVGDILSKDAGSVTFSGTLNVMDYITNTVTQVAIPPFTVSVSY